MNKFKYLVVGGVAFFGLSALCQSQDAASFNKYDITLTVPHVDEGVQPITKVSVYCGVLKEKVPGVRGKALLAEDKMVEIPLEAKQTTVTLPAGSVPTGVGYYRKIDEKGNLVPFSLGTRDHAARDKAMGQGPYVFCGFERTVIASGAHVEAKGVSVSDDVKSITWKFEGPSPVITMGAQ